MALRIIATSIALSIMQAFANSRRNPCLLNSQRTSVRPQLSRSLRPVTRASGATMAAPSEQQQKTGVSQIGLVGLAVMGQNLALNVAGWMAGIMAVAHHHHQAESPEGASFERAPLPPTVLLSLCARRQGIQHQRVQSYL